MIAKHVCHSCHKTPLIKAGPKPRPLSSYFDNCSICRGQLAQYVEEGNDLAGFTIGERIEADLWRGCSENEDGISSGGGKVTKPGYVAEIDAFDFGMTSLFLRFDDGDVQVVDAKQLDGAEKGYPCNAFRRIGKVGA